MKLKKVKTLADLKNDSRINKVWSEDDNGFWAELAPGWMWDGCSCIHEFTIAKLCIALDEAREVSL